MSTVTPLRPAAPSSRDQRSRAAAAPRITSGVDPFRVLRRYMLLILTAGFVGGAIGVGAHVALARWYPLYTGQVLFEIQPGVQDVRDIGTNDIFQDQLVLRLAMTETMLLASRDVIEATMRDRQVRATNWFKNGYVLPDGRELIDEAVDDLLEDLKTSVVRNTNLFELAWTTHSPSDVPTVLNTVASAYIDKREALDDRKWNDNVRVFRDENTKTQNQIQDLNQAIETFIRNNQIVTLGDPRDSPLSHRVRELTDTIVSTDTQRSRVETAYMQTAAKLEGTIEPTPEDFVGAEQDPSIVSLGHRVLEMKAQLRHLYEMYQPEHPSLKRAESMMRATEAERNDKIKEIMRMRLEATLKQLGDERDSVRTSLERLEQEEEAQMIKLRDLTASHTVYESMATQRDYLEQHRDADLQLIKEVQLMQLRDDARRVRLAQQALPPRERAFPKLELVVPLSALLVVSLTVGLIFLREFTDQRVRSASDLAMVPGAQVVGIIPDRSEDPTRPKTAELVVRRHSNSVLAESYRQAFSMVSKSVNRAGHQALVLLGGLPGAGTTTVASNLAATWAAAGRRVILVDANFRRPALAEILGAEPNGAGLGDVLTGSSSARDVIVNVSPNLSLMSAGTPANRVFELLNTRQFDSMLAQLRDEFDVILFDAPPAMVAGEAMALASKVDAALMVVRAGQEQRGLVARLINQLADAHCELIGILLNRPRGTAGGYFRKNFATMASYNAERE